MTRQVHADPDAMAKFATHLNDFSTGMLGEIGRLRSHFDGLDWQDAQGQQFASEVAEMADRLRAFLSTSNDIAQKVRRKTEPLNDYLNLSS
ncbi:conserved hypothetical protein [Frankia sp. Hr75.2]|uniref:WXG100 family type VII secretion target n=1 Tax=Parafrankia soli TaxID=2599596 RepID=UPI0010426045|nr:WXG100 family type VII secretion target [Parafrankia soli]CAI7973812.1 conserved hypothetical protein [Frankia sp. Hr75.2]